MSFIDLLDDCVKVTGSLYKAQEVGSQVLVKTITGHLQTSGGDLENTITLGITHNFYCDSSELSTVDMNPAEGVNNLVIGTDNYQIVDIEDKSYLDDDLSHFKLILKKNVS